MRDDTESDDDDSITVPGLCIEGRIAEKEEASAFPLGPEIQARLTVILNTALLNSVELDHRIVPWDAVRSRAVLVSVLHEEEVAWSRDPSRDILLWPGHTATITAYPVIQHSSATKYYNALQHLTINRGSLPHSSACSSAAFPAGPGRGSSVRYTRPGCRNTVMQMIAERSVNCSLLSLPASPASQHLPTCGPLEGLALMYILREQGDLVTHNPTIRTRYSYEFQFV